MTSLVLTTQVHFHGSHRLTAPEHRKQEVGEVCDVIHGHRYSLRASFKKSMQDTEQALFPRGLLQELLENTIKAPLHNKDLNEILTNTSGECIAKWCFEQIKATEFGDWLIQVELIETHKNSFVYSEV